MAEQWLSISEYARTFGVSDMTVRRRVKTGRLHAVLKEGKYFIPVPVGEVRSGSNIAPSMGDAPRFNDRPAPPQQQPKRPNEMQVIKGHPQAHKTFVPSDARQNMAPPRDHAETHQQQMTRADYVLTDDSDAMIPVSLRRPLAGSETSLVDTRALIAFCEATMRKVSEGERRTVEKFKSKLEALEATLISKDMEIKTLRQQVEDLQLLVKILEKKKNSV